MTLCFLRLRGLHAGSWFLSVAVLALALFGIATTARALPPIRGAVDGRALFELKGRLGGAITTDFWVEESVFRIGAVLGAGAFSGRDEYSSRVITPFGVSVALLPFEDASGPVITLRGGGYAGARKSGLYVGSFAAAALGYNYALGEGASVRFGVDGWAVLGDGQGFFLAPYLGLGF